MACDGASQCVYLGFVVLEHTVEVFHGQLTHLTRHRAACRHIDSTVTYVVNITRLHGYVDLCSVVGFLMN